MSRQNILRERGGGILKKHFQTLTMQIWVIHPNDGTIVKQQNF